jgi:ABC-type multidrug transport system fused ATPase/permease subunit
VGPSGAGKTTIVGLIARLFDPTGGRILVDGNDLRTLDVKDWRGRIGIVSQDIFIFNDTVTSNICFPRASAPKDRLREAVALASADSFVEELPEGFGTRLGDRGTRLSGGQQQRIAIARAVVAEPDILILDEATSHLDSLTETAIQRAIDTLSHQVTLIVVAHRLSTVRKADRIIVLQQGRIIEQGTHAELSKAQGQYWHLLSHQLLGLVE